MQNLTSDLINTINPNRDDLQTILNEFDLLSTKKGTVPAFGKVATHLQFIEDGLLRVYILDNDARDVTIQIGIGNMWVNNLYSFLNQVPSNCYVEILEPSILYRISKQDLEKLFVKVPIMETFFRLKIQQAYCRLQDRTLNQVNKSAEERYLEFQSRYGKIETLVPQYIIASYLNISPEHLSKVRNKLSKG